MTMREEIFIALSFFIGAILGTLFFTGLWWTVRRMAARNSSPLWLVGSWTLRMSLAVYGFYTVTTTIPGNSGLFALLSALIGFLAARFGVNRLVQRSPSCI